VLADLLHWMGYGLCHQLPERSFFGGGVQAPVCARDTGIYVGMVVSIALIALLHHRERPKGLPRGYAWAFMGACVLFMAWDGVTSYAGMRTTTNDLRLLSGLGVGFSAGLLLVPLLNDTLWRHASPRPVLGDARRFGIWVLAIPATFAAVKWAAPMLGVWYPVLVALCILAALAAVNLLIVALLPAFDRRAERMRDLVRPVLVASMLAIAEIWLAGALRDLLLDLARGR